MAPDGPIDVQSVLQVSVVSIVLTVRIAVHAFIPSYLTRVNLESLREYFFTIFYSKAIILFVWF